MVRASRLMLRREPQPRRGRQQVAAHVRIASVAVGGAWLVFHWPVLTLAVGGTCALLTFVRNRRERRRLSMLAALRRDEAICSFVRALPIREIDTRVVRATFDELRNYLKGEYNAFPLRPSDRPVEDLGIDPEDLEDIVVKVADRVGRSLDGYATNPRYQRLQTAGDLIMFLSNQPKV